VPNGHTYSLAVNHKCHDNCLGTPKNPSNEHKYSTYENDQLLNCLICNSPLQQCDLNSLCPPLLVLQEIEKIRQQCTHEGVHKDGPEYRSKIEAATKKYMPLSVSTIYTDAKTSCFLHLALQWYPSFSCLMNTL